MTDRPNELDFGSRATPRMYVAVCRSLHLAIGPFLSLDAVAAACQVLNEKGPCVYVPILLSFVGEVMSPEQMGAESMAVDDEGRAKRGYL